MDSARDEMRDSAPAVAAPRAAALLALVERTLAGMGYELVELERAGGGLLRVTLDLAPGEVGAYVPAGVADDDADEAQERHIGIEDCERVSRHLTHLFAVEDVDYDRLEVSSPGMDRPLRGARDFARFAGEMAKVQLFSAAEGRRRVRGQILGVVPAFAADAATGDGQQLAAAGDCGPGPGSGQRVRMLLLPEAPPPPPRGARKQRARKAAPGEVIEFALADVEKARLAPEWEFDRNAIPRTAPQDPQISD